MYINDTLHIINTLKTLGVEQFTKLTVFEKSDDETDNEQQKVLDQIKTEHTKGVAIVELEESRENV